MPRRERSRPRQRIRSQRSVMPTLEHLESRVTLSAYPRG
jgi:hypothetical protein